VLRSTTPSPKKRLRVSCFTSKSLSGRKRKLGLETFHHARSSYIVSKMDVNRYYVTVVGKDEQVWEEGWADTLNGATSNWPPVTTSMKAEKRPAVQGCVGPRKATGTVFDSLRVFRIFTEGNLVGLSDITFFATGPLLCELRRCTYAGRSPSGSLGHRRSSSQCPTRVRRENDHLGEENIRSIQF